MANRGMRRNRGAEITSFLSKHPGMPFTAQEIQEGCHFPVGPSERARVVAALGHLVRIQSGVETFTRGTWTFTNKRESKKTEVQKPATPEVFEYVGSLKDGSSLVRDVDNKKLYRLEEA